MHSPPRRQQSGERIPGPALVTGANGYVASWVVRRLLERGFEVRATVRDPADPRKTEHLLAMAGELPGTLSLFRADLMERGGFDRAMAGCALVFHTASPVVVRGVEDPVRQLIEPAIRGTRHVLEAVNRTPTVRRVVLTSSVSAIYGDTADLGRIEADRFDESHWNETSSERHLPYSYAKTEAERLAWRIAGKQDRWDLVVVNPGLVLGPSLDPHSSPESVQLMRELGNGSLRLGVAHVEFGIVDVRDVAEGHLLALERGRDGARYLLGSRDGNLTLAQAFGILSGITGVRAPRVRVPCAVAVGFAHATAAVCRALRRPPLVGPEAARMASTPMWVDPSRSVDELGLPQTPVAEAFREAVDWFAYHGYANAPRSAAAARRTAGRT